MSGSQWFASSLGKKYLVAGTGAVLFLFVCAHLLGNLQVYLGAAVFNHYAHMLKGNPEILWPSRIVLLVCVTLHLWFTIALTLENRAARDQRYAVQQIVDATLAAHTMIWTGAIIGCFVAYHLAHFTLFWTNPDYRQLDPYHMLVTGFRQPVLAVVYLLGVGLLCFHLSHGISAMCQSLGLKNEVHTARINRAAATIAILLFLGYASIPISVLLGVVH